MNRKQPIMVGNLVWIEQCKRFCLPEGLNDGLQVRVLRYEPSRTVKVQTEDGKRLGKDTLFEGGGNLRS